MVLSGSLRSGSRWRCRTPDVERVRLARTRTLIVPRERIGGRRRRLGRRLVLVVFVTPRRRPSPRSSKQSPMKDSDAFRLLTITSRLVRGYKLGCSLLKPINTVSRIGMIAGNGRFPFPRAAGCPQPRSRRHRRRGEGRGLSRAGTGGARRAAPTFHLGLARPPGQVYQDSQGRRGLPGGHGGAGQAREDLLRHRAGPDAAVGAHEAQGAEYRRADLRGRRGHARPASS